VATVKCRNCGSENDLGEGSCAYCGSPLPRRKASEDEARETAAAPEPQANDDPFAPMVSAVLRLPTGRVISLEPGDRLVIGRGQDSPLADMCTDNISREHAFISMRGDGAYLTDNRSTNGTYLNGRRLEADREYRLAGQTAISLGTDPPLRIDVEVNES
jgi:pSer/pThr/pTyr-binding forkhead associated (FHA) protein